MKTKNKPAAKKTAKSAPKKTAAKKAPAKKAAKKVPAKKAAKVAKKTAPKASKLPAKKAAKIAKQVNAATRKPQDPKTLKVVTGHKAGSLPDDVTQHGVLRPREGTQGRKLWGVCDGLKKKLGRAPARFEFREAIQNFKGLDGKTNINPDSASFQYFAWRKFHGIKGRSIGIYPKRNSFEANTPAPAVKVATKKAVKVPAKKAAKKTTAADVKRHKRLATAAIGKPPAKTPAKKATPAKKPAAKVTNTRLPKSAATSTPKPATVPAAPVSERAAKASEAAKATPGVLVVTPPAPAAV